MFRIVAIVLLMCMGHAQLALGETKDGVAIVPALLTKRVQPRYPAKAIDRRQEGWVDLKFTITPEGNTSDIQVAAAYPRGVFERSAINALAKWLYMPRTEGGVPAPQPGNHAVLSFALSETSVIGQPAAGTIAAAIAQLSAGNWEGAQRTIHMLAEMDGLNLAELGTLERLRGRLAFGMHDYDTAVDDFTRALAITGRFDPVARPGIAQMLVIAAIHARQFDRAIEAFDAWHPTDTPQTRDLRRTIEAIRSARAAGRNVDVAPPPMTR